MDIKDTLLQKPPPSDYTKGKNSAILQTFPKPVLFFRPAKCCGLPIFLFHPVFARYLLLRKEALPATHEARTVLHVASVGREKIGQTGDRTWDFPFSCRALYH